MDACRVLALIEEARAEEVDQLLLSTVGMLSNKTAYVQVHVQV
jgi:hypothetical protein